MTSITAILSRSTSPPLSQRPLPGRADEAGRAQRITCARWRCRRRSASRCCPMCRRSRKQPARRITKAWSWHMLLMPSKTPRPIVERLHTEMKRIMAAPDMREKIAAVGLIPNNSPSIEEMRGYIASEHVKWGALVKQFGSRGLAIGPGGREGFAVNAAQGAAAATGQDAVAGLEWQPSVTGGLCKLLQECRKTFREGLFF